MANPLSHLVPRLALGAAAAVLLPLLAGCSDPATPAQESPSPATSPAATVAAASPAASPAAAVGLVNRVWSVRQSSAVAPGTLYVFLSDGTLVITSPKNKPLVGTWKRDGKGLVMVEEGHPYKTDILGLTADSFRIRSNNPGTPVEITLAPADTGGA